MSDGYRDEAARAGAAVRADIVECHVVRPRAGNGWEFVQVLRAREPLRGTWQPVLGHCEAGEGAVACVVRELREEIGLDVDDPSACEGLFALEQVRPFYLWRIDAVVLGPRFVAVVRPSFEARLNEESVSSRWVAFEGGEGAAFWPGQREALRDIARDLLDPSSPSREALRVLR